MNTNGWHPMDTAPKDGRKILARRHNDVSYEYCIVWWDGACTYPWGSHGTAYPEDRLDDWHEIPGNAPPVNESNASTAPGMQRGNCKHGLPLKDHCDECANDFRNAN